MKTGATNTRDLAGIGEFVRRYPKYRPLVLCEVETRPAVERAGFEAMTWIEFLLRGPPAMSS